MIYLPDGYTFDIGLSLRLEDWRWMAHVITRPLKFGSVTTLFFAAWLCFSVTVQKDRLA